MGTEPRMFISPSYEFYNQCHGEGGRFCEGEDGPGRVRDNVKKGNFMDEDDGYRGDAFNDGISDLNTVYHVTSPETAESVERNGFNTKYADSRNNWGRGLYFAVNKNEAYGIYAATHDQRGNATQTLKVRTNVKNPLILETDSTGNFYQKLRNVLNPDAADYLKSNVDSSRREAEDYGDPFDSDRHVKNNLGSYLRANGNDALLVRNPGGGGNNIGGEQLIVTDASLVHPA